MAMDGFHRQVLDKVPLAEATLRVLSFALEDSFLAGLYKEHCGEGYTKVLTFPLITQLVCDALFQNKSGRSVFEKANQEKILPATVKAAYGKLSRMPVAVSTALLSGCSERLGQLFPEGCEETSLPGSLATFAGIVVDGKVTKKIPHRLKALRGKSGGLVGGRGLVAYRLESGLALAMEGHEDGDANELPWLAKLVAKVREGTSGPRLWIGDRQFSFLSSLAEFSGAGDEFVVRYSRGIPYERDDSRMSCDGKDDDKRDYIEEWGWLGKTKNSLRRYVRRITVRRGGKDDLIVVTSLLDANRYPAADVLEVYRSRTRIEYVFQRITEVFSLRRLIGTSPRATLFQLSLSLMLYNVLQLVRAYLANNNAMKVDRVSPKKVLESIREQLTASLVLLGIGTLSDCLKEPGTLAEMKQFLKERLNKWDQRWTKAEPRRQRPEKPKRRRRHDSAYRLIEKSKAHGS
jgi:hypothetical protein